MPFTFKVASEDWEFEQIHQLNYKIFVEEIPHHAPNPNHSLIDTFHQENTYLICLNARQLAGMVAVRDKRPFSLDAKLDDLDAYLPPYRSICEIRLLAVDPTYRNPRVFQGIIGMLANYVDACDYDLAVMSGIVQQQKLYRQLGFTPFAQLLGTSEVQFQPMYLTKEAYRKLKAHSKAFLASHRDEF